MPAFNLPRPLILIVGIIGVFMVLLAGTAGVFAYAQKDVYYPGVRVAGVNLGGLTKEEAQEKVRAQVASYQTHPVVVTLPDITQPRQEATGEYPELEVTATTADLGLDFKQTEALEAAWEIGHTRSFMKWPVDMATSLFTTQSIPLGYIVAPEKIDVFVNTHIVPRIVTPTPATIKIEGTAITVEDAKPGLSVDVAELSKKLAVSLPGAIEQTGLYIKAPVTTAEANVTRTTLQPVVAQLEALGDLKIVLQNGSSQLKPTRAQLLTWFSLSQDEQGAVTASINTDVVTKYLKEKGGSKVDLTPSLKLVNEALVKSLAESEKLTVATTLASRSVTLVQKPDVKTEPEAGSYTLGLFPGKYLQVNLREQKLYRINGNTLEKVYTVSTGKWSTPTPVGTFTIAGKHRRAFSRTYGLYMPYWMNFVGTATNGEDLPTGSYGLHELPEWPNGYKEGQGHLGTAVSHGCVRLGVGDAPEVYEWADEGTHVVIN